MKFLKTLAAIDTEVAFRWNQTLYRIKTPGVARVPPPAGHQCPEKNS
jgi:hypothetical protein